MRGTALRSKLRGVLIRAFPRWMARALAVRSRRQSHRFLRSLGSEDLNDRLISSFGPCVRSGPFDGLRLSTATRVEHLGPFLLGTYEQELHPWLRELQLLPIRKVIDIGAKFGYYAVGFARWFPEGEVIAVDTDPWARRALKEMARENGISNMEIRGYTTASALAEMVVPGTLVFSDCEGFEDALFADATASLFRESWLVIETHEALVPGVEARLRRRFEATHQVRFVDEQPRRSPVQVEGILTDQEAKLAVNEMRGAAQRWLYLEPRVMKSGPALRQQGEQRT